MDQNERRSKRSRERQPDQSEPFCRARLREPKSERTKISEVATTAGFSDISYFNRAFRARFGATPKDIRGGLDR